jgi:hypothetical protein
MASPDTYRPLIVRPGKIWTYFGTVGGFTAETSYLNSWLVDARAHRPLRTNSTSGTVSWTGAKSTNFVGLFNHNLDPGATVTVTVGAVGVIMVVPTYDDDEIPMGIWGFADPAQSVSSVSISVSGHTGPLVLGEFVAGFYETLEGPIISGANRAYNQHGIINDGDFDGIPTYDLGINSRVLSGDTVCKSGGLVFLKQMWLGQRNGSLPSVMVPEPGKMDAWIGRLTDFSYEQVHPEYYKVPISFMEYPRVRWD